MFLMCYIRFMFPHTSTRYQWHCLESWVISYNCILVMFLHNHTNYLNQDYFVEFHCTQRSSYSAFVYSRWFDIFYSLLCTILFVIIPFSPILCKIHESWLYTKEICMSWVNNLIVLEWRGMVQVSANFERFFWPYYVLILFTPVLTHALM